ncbi:hypothetical protein D9611_000022 [Ephemerocybe angulata]|uniref:NFX1-type zinc finger-containing protein 1 n=1 Tax=Ephemerocybe angulata TaxID=980116 RepID=A0A8H5F759_9AGAR|nr:hypothetical protein D9611_000022 [Tulosesus angulatus]
MSQTNRGICYDYRTPRGCRRGARCIFSHDTGSNGNPASPPRASQSNHDNRSPRGSCHSWISRGRCKKGDACPFKHDRPPPTTSSATGPVPLLSGQGIATLDITNPDIFRSLSDNPLSAAEINSFIKSYLYDDFRFAKTFNVYAFWIPFQSAHRSNKNWTDDDGQLLLNSIAERNGLLRINDISQWREVSLSAGMNPRILSFQRGYYPLLSLLSSDFVVKSTRTHLVHALYMRVLENVDHFTDHVESCVNDALAAGSFNDQRSGQSENGISAFEVFNSLSTVLFECLTRFKNAVATYPRLVPLVEHLQQWVELWVSKVTSRPPTFVDSKFVASSPETREFIISHLRDKTQRLLTITEREQRKESRAADRLAEKPWAQSSNEGVVSALNILYKDAGLGSLRPTGPRHDNDLDNISDIRIAPTEEELICETAPYLPANFFEAPHHEPAESMERLLDIQFRLLREEGTAPLRTSVQLIRSDILTKGKKKTQLSELIKKRGGKYKGFVDKEDSVMFNVYTNVEFVNLSPDRRGISVQIAFDTPPGGARAKSGKARAAFWESMGGKRLMQGGLVALVWEERGSIGIHLGILATTVKEITEFVKGNPNRVVARIVFFDTSVQLRILQGLKKNALASPGVKLLVESPVMFESIRPFLEALRVEPESIPFKPYLVHQPSGALQASKVSPPKYACMPGFQYQLAPLFPPESGVTDLKLSATNPESISNAREALKASRLDSSQADAVIDTLTREVALIQGPPGTGKSYVGIELLRILLASARPVLMIAFTNHALDHMLHGVLDAKITDKIVRLGGRSADERVSQFSIDNLEQVAGKAHAGLDRMSRRNYYDLKESEKAIETFMHKFMRKDASPEDITQYLRMQYPEHAEYLSSPPGWVRILYDDFVKQEDGWSTQGKKGKAKEVEKPTMYAFWVQGYDINFLSTPEYPQPVAKPEAAIRADVTQKPANRFDILPQEQEVEDEIDDDDEIWQSVDAWPEGPSPALSAVDESEFEFLEPADVGSLADGVEAMQVQLEAVVLSNVERFFLDLGERRVPEIPSSTRDLDYLLAEGLIWDMSITERQVLHKYWENDVLTRRAATHEEDFDALRRQHEKAQKVYNECKDEMKRQLLKNTDIVGCTTTGAARLSSLLKVIAPRILLVEEAGQVLEAHILGSLVPSVEHLVLIGDPLQLRPTLNNYSLSMDSERGRKLYRFDMSLMERLSSSGFPMSQIDVQRRMRPEISNLIRKTLYPKLIDNDLVKNYPDVRGFTKNVFFLDHEHPENDGSADDTSSKFNTYEVEMIRDLVLYLLRQGCYSQEGDIVVLCAYLGQLAKVRDALSDLVAVVIDERDQTELDDREEEVDELRQESQVNHIKISSRVRLRTVDNYQGEEARIVILSLVRNAGPSVGIDAGLRKTIGFLRSENRSNVSLSRAKEGLFILGNKNQFSARSGMWKGVIDELESNGCVGKAFPIACHQHPEIVQLVSKPGEMTLLSPDGGCFQSCNARLKCGHVCPYKCHPDDPNHIGVLCSQKCSRVCPRQHPCRLECSQDCGKCMNRIPNVRLPCGHHAPFVYCHQMDLLDDVVCNARVEKRLPTCEHSAELSCSQDPATYVCRQPCNNAMECCGRTCNSDCSACQKLNAKPSIGNEVIPRTHHQQHKCQKILFCAHSCANMCSQNHECTTACKEECRQECAHSKCKSYCSNLCSPCKQPCAWRCPHAQCPVPCGSICVRMPCDERCKKTLKCGHPCPSVCGEDCKVQKCISCADENTKDSVVDLVMGRKLSEIPADSEDPDDVLITLPKCGHVFTVETLDGVCGIRDWYGYDDTVQKWSGLRVPTSKNSPPVCPTCRAAITSPRYGRIFKAADLDILEKNVITKMTQGLGGVQKDLNAIDDEAIALAITEGLEQIKPPSTRPPTTPANAAQARKKAHAALFQNKSRLEPIEAGAFTDDKLFPFAPETAALWKKSIRPITKLLSDITRVAKVRPAHIHAWESAYTYLYNQEIETAASDPENAPRNPHEYAARMARLKLGQPQPRADRRFLIEGIWISVTLRLTLLKLVSKVLETMSTKPAVFNQGERAMWAQYGWFILRSCEEDCELAYTLAEDSQSRRQMTTSRRFALRTSLDKFTFKMSMLQYMKKFQEHRDELLELACVQKHVASQLAHQTSQEHLHVKPDDQDWLQDNFNQVTSKVLEEWGSIERSIRMDTFYQPVTIDEQRDIVKAMGFSHTGHWYNCPNGHTFVITECGGAMQQARCPECGEAIGGGNHNLISSNQRADDFEALAREHGAAGSPWPWAQ